MTRTFLDLYSGMFRFTFFFISSWVRDDSTSGPTTSTTLDAKRSSATPRYLILLSPPIVKEQKRKCAEVHYVGSPRPGLADKVRKISRYLESRHAEWRKARMQRPLLFLKIPSGARSLDPVAKSELKYSTRKCGYCSLGYRPRFCGRPQCSPSMPLYLLRSSWTLESLFRCTPMEGRPSM